MYASLDQLTYRGDFGRLEAPLKTRRTYSVPGRCPSEKRAGQPFLGDTYVRRPSAADELVFSTASRDFVSPGRSGKHKKIISLEPFPTR